MTIRDAGCAVCALTLDDQVWRFQEAFDFAPDERLPLQSMLHRCPSHGYEVISRRPGRFSLPGRGSFAGSLVNVTFREGVSLGPLHVLGHPDQVGHLVESLVPSGCCLSRIRNHVSNPLIVPINPLDKSCTRARLIFASRLERWLLENGAGEPETRFIQHMRIPGFRPNHTVLDL